MKNWLRTEELIQFLASIVLFSQMDFSWWVFPALILLPDLSMVGYIVSPKIGAIVYNLGHHKGLAVLIGLTGWYIRNNYLELAGLILFAHSALDRTLGYGLKFPDDFKHTHLGEL
ncbi:MAG: DUF4260 domain-containing protein [Siphonobacter sp.]